WVEDDRAEALSGRAMDPVDQLPFVIRLPADGSGSPCARMLLDGSIDVGQRAPPIDRRLSRSQQIQIRPMEHEHGASSAGGHGGAENTPASRKAATDGRDLGPLFTPPRRDGHSSAAAAGGAAVRRRPIAGPPPRSRAPRP